jgi:predicted MFS family arabinose efflux permease
MADTTAPTTSSRGRPGRAPERIPGRTQGILLMFISCLPILGAVLLAPILPSMEDAFAGTPGVSALVPITLTIPALMIGLLAPFAGGIVDRFGRTRLLVVALVVYAVFGTAPLWLEGLPAIVLSRAGVGVTEAAIMTCCTTLIADYFAGAERDRWLGLQTVFASVSATVFFAVGGGLGGISWRAPFWMYASSLVFAVLAARLLWQPAAGPADDDHVRGELPALPWRSIMPAVVVTLFGGVVFYTTIVELPFALDAVGVTAVSTIGAMAALASAATAAGAFTFGRVARRGTAILLPIAFGLAGLGLAVMGATDAVAPIVAGAVIASAGTGLMLPTLLVWAITPLSYLQRGRGTGLWTAALFIGEFLCPLLVLALTAVVGGLGGALVVLGVVSLAMALGTRVGLTHSRGDAELTTQ